MMDLMLIPKTLELNRLKDFSPCGYAEMGMGRVMYYLRMLSLPPITRIGATAISVASEST